MDINKVWLSGQVVTSPTKETIGGETKLAFFILKIQEKFTNRKNEERFHENYVRVECLGRSVDRIMTMVKKNGRFMVDGYIRQDRVGNRDDVRVRAFAVYPDESLATHNYSSGLATALQILDSSMDLDSAREKIEELIKK